MGKAIVNVLIIPFLLLFASPSVSDAQPRIKQSINAGWKFTLNNPDTGNWKSVNIPHTWNNKDAFDETPGYKRTIGWYKRILDLNPKSDKKYVLLFEAVNQVAEVFVNGEKAGQHKGGYTAFTVDITPHLKEMNNQIRVKVDNRHNENIPPLKGDFNFYGGVYRDVWLLELNPVHFDFGEYASSGVYITTPEVSEASASLKVQGNIKNERANKDNITVINSLRDPDGKVIAEKEKKLQMGEDGITFSETFVSVKSPMLWHPDHPRLYTLESKIKTGNKILDQVATSVGFRWFRFDPDSGFYLNGSRLKLMGVNRHQDYAGKGNALSNARHFADVKLAKETGSNFLRTAHYPQDPAVLEACDRLGLLVSMEIPLDHEITDSKAFYENAVNMQREMIRQHFNRPSIIIWAYMNEMLLGRSWEKDQKDIRKIVAFANKLEKVTREEDPTRYTMIPNHGNFNLYHKVGLTDIPMIVGWNLYFGWYESELEGLGKFLDQHHAELPEKPAIITEYGAGSDPRIRAPEPLRFDFSVEWQTRFLQSNLGQINKRPFVAGAAVWNLFDFGSESRRDAVPTINSKGLMSFDRQPKDAYYLLQSWLKDESIVRIGSKSWDQRSGKTSEDNSDYAVREVEVYGNTEGAELVVNGQSLGFKSFKNHIARWDVPFRDGENVLRVKADKARDVATIDFQLHSAHPTQKFENIYINAGSNFHFIDEPNGIVWFPDKPYKEGFWGYYGGKNFHPRNRGIGTSADILGTDRDPLFQTQRSGVEMYKFDTPAGTYEIKFLFASLKNEKANIFDTFVNDNLVLDDFQLGSQNRAVMEKVIVTTDQNLTVAFEANQGEAVVNGIGVRKIN